MYEENSYQPGEYIIIQNGTKENSHTSKFSAMTTFYETNTKLQIDKIIEVPHESVIRGRVAKTSHWITIKDTKTEKIFAKVYESDKDVTTKRKIDFQ